MAIELRHRGPRLCSRLQSVDSFEPCDPPSTSSINLPRRSRTSHEIAALWGPLVAHVKTMPQRTVVLRLWSHIRWLEVRVCPHTILTPSIISSSMSQLAVLAASGLVLCLAWLLVRNYVVKSPLDKISGPPSGSVLSGV